MQPNNIISGAQSSRSNALRQLIVNQVLASGGKLEFERFMELALYQPELGYYQADTEKFGETGDFVTASGLTPFFGRCVARQIADLLVQQPTMRVLEYGAGNGQLALAVLAELARLGLPPVGYDIVEVSSALRKRQKQLLAEQLPEHFHRINWLDQNPTGYRGVIIANELLDALPVKRLVKTPAGFDQVAVALDGDKLQLATAVLGDPQLAERLDSLDLPTGYLTEINLSAEKWVEGLGQVLDEGLVLLLDYGYSRAEYYHPQRDRGTFLCYFRHTAADDPLDRLGLQDMTAHIDFTAMAEAGSRGGLELAGFTTQANFLISCGILDQLAELSQDNDYVDALAPVKQLLLPGGMGEVFKVLALTKKYAEPLRGMATRDICHTL